MSTSRVPVRPVLCTHFQTEVSDLTSQRILIARHSEDDALQQLVERFRRSSSDRFRWLGFRRFLFRSLNNFDLFLRRISFVSILFVFFRSRVFRSFFSGQNISTRKRSVAFASLTFRVDTVFLQLIKTVAGILGTLRWLSSFHYWAKNKTIINGFQFALAFSQSRWLEEKKYITLLIVAHTNCFLLFMPHSNFCPVY